jgi:hypothetical protein
MLTRERTRQVLGGLLYFYALSNRLRRVTLVGRANAAVVAAQAYKAAALREKMSELVYPSEW